MTEGYQQIPFSDRLSSDFPTGKEDCNCVLLQYWENKGNEFMADGYRKLLANNIKLRSM